MLKVNEEWILAAEEKDPGFRKTLDYYEALNLPPCPTCGSIQTAKVSTGLVGRSINLAAATTKIMLVPNGHPAGFHCGDCDHFFQVKSDIERAEEQLRKAMLEPGDTDWIQDLPEYVALPTTDGEVVAILGKPHGAPVDEPKSTTLVIDLLDAERGQPHWLSGKREKPDEK